MVRRWSSCRSEMEVRLGHREQPGGCRVVVLSVRRSWTERLSASRSHCARDRSVAWPGVPVSSGPEVRERLRARTGERLPTWWRAVFARNDSARRRGRARRARWSLQGAAAGDEGGSEILAGGRASLVSGDARDNAARLDTAESYQVNAIWGRRCKSFRVKATKRGSRDRSVTGSRGRWRVASSAESIAQWVVGWCG